MIENFKSDKLIVPSFETYCHVTNQINKRRNLLNGVKKNKAFEDEKRLIWGLRKRFEMTTNDFKAKKKFIKQFYWTCKAKEMGSSGECEPLESC